MVHPFDPASDHPTPDRPRISGTVALLAALAGAVLALVAAWTLAAAAADQDMTQVRDSIERDIVEMEQEMRQAPPAPAPEPPPAPVRGA